MGLGGVRERGCLVDRGRAKDKTRKRTRAHGGCLWLSEAKKDVISCEKPRLGANAR